jgi:hypothetical protein
VCAGLREPHGYRPRRASIRTLGEWFALQAAASYGVVISGHLLTDAAPVRGVASGPYRVTRGPIAMTRGWRLPAECDCVAGPGEAAYQGGRAANISKQ